MGQIRPKCTETDLKKSQSCPIWSQSDLTSLVIVCLITDHKVVITQNVAPLIFTSSRLLKLRQFALVFRLSCALVIYLSLRSQFCIGLIPLVCVVSFALVLYPISLCCQFCVGLIPISSASGAVLSMLGAVSISPLR